MARISVVLPAPFGPSSPVTPGPNEQLSSDSATFGPNHTDTPRPSTVASATNAGSVRRRSTGGGSGTHRSPLHPPVAAQQHADGRRATRHVRAATPAGRRWPTPPSGDVGSMWPRNTRSRRYSGSASTLIERRGRSVVAADVADEDARRDRRDEEQPDDGAPATMRRSVSDDDGHADHGVVQGEQHDGDRHLPQHVEVPGEVVERAVAHEHVADEQHDLGQEREGEQDRGDRADLGDARSRRRSAGGRTSAAARAGGGRGTSRRARRARRTAAARTTRRRTRGR